MNAAGDETITERPKSPVKPILITAIIATLAILAISMMGTQGAVRKSYGFIKVDHPVDMWNDGRDRWAYYSIGSEDVAKLAQDARTELLPLGFKEETSMKPWFRFLNGTQEVIVCAHDEIELNGSKLAPHRKYTGMPKPTRKWAVVHVKNGPGSRAPLISFKALKLVHGW